MKKWNVEVTFTIQAETRTKAWELSREVCRKHLRDLANVESVTLHPVSDDWIAVNEPIRKVK